MEAPQAPHVSLQFDGASGLWEVYHQLTSERVALPQGDGRWERHEDETGAVCLRRGQEAVWLSQFLNVTLLQDEGQCYFVLLGVEGQEEILPLQRYRGRFAQDSVALSLPGGMSVFVYFRFEVRWSGCRYYWHLGELWARAGIDSKMTASQWQESWWPHWKSFAQKLGLNPLDTDAHLRRASPTRLARENLVDPRSGLLGRVLPAATCSTWVLFALLARFMARSARRGGKNSTDTVEAFKVLCKAFTVLRSAWMMRVFLDSDARCSPESPPQGHCPVDLRVAEDGVVDVSALGGCGQVGGEVLSFLGGDTIDIADLLVAGCQGGEQRFFLLKQVVWHLFRRCERHLDRGRCQPSGAAHPIPTMIVPSEDEGPEPPLKKTRLQLPQVGRFARGQSVSFSRFARLKYFFGMRRKFRSGTYFSVCIDGSRLRREGILVGAIAQPNNVAAWLPPQAADTGAPHVSGMRRALMVIPFVVATVVVSGSRDPIVSWASVPMLRPKAQQSRSRAQAPRRLGGRRIR